jgi:hypothetical protein
VYDFVDKIYILYTDTPSHGHSGCKLSNPDTRDKLRAAAHTFTDPKGKINWHEGKWTHEGQQRDSIYEISKSDHPDMIITVDSDEIWRPETITSMINEGSKSEHREYMIKMLTFWRSFSWICTDNMLPIRMVCPKKPSGKRYIDDRVLHFGYARSIDAIKYKMSIHGHLNEWRKDWFDRYCNWPKSGNNDLHPTCVNTWNAIPYDKTQMPEFMRSHPYYNLDII